MVKLLHMNTLEIASSWLAQEIGDPGISPEYLLDLCFESTVKLLAVVPNWKLPGRCEIDWMIGDGQSSKSGPVNFVSGNGLISITPKIANRIQTHGSASFSAAEMPVIDVTPSGMSPSHRSLFGIHDDQRMLEMSHLRVTRDEVEALVEKLSNKSTISVSTPPLPAFVEEHKNEKTWQERAREIADIFDATDAKSGAHDSLTSIAQRVENKMRTLGIHGPRGPLSSGTILREALQGQRWTRKR